MKSFSTVRDTQRGSQSYIEKRRGRREIEVTRRRIGVVKRGETNLASNQFPKSSLMFSGFGFNPAASGFQFYFYSSF